MSNRIVIREKDGTIKATLSGVHASNVLTGMKGTWDSIKYKGEPRRSCFIIKEGAIYTSVSNSGKIEMYINEGDIILPDNT